MKREYRLYVQDILDAIEMIDEFVVTTNKKLKNRLARLEGQVKALRLRGLKL